MITLRHLTFAVIAGIVFASSAVAADQKVTLSLGGKFCDLYLGDVESALKKVAGVTAVDFKSQKGHAVVTGDAGKMKPDQLVTAVNGVKGDGWHCKAEVKK
ncbi:MAG: cation transporter [Nitrospiraceae bacterium]